MGAPKGRIPWNKGKRIISPIDRFNKFLSKDANGCWNWIGHCGYGGYGVFWFEGKNILAHRWAYEYFKEKIPERLTLDHLCRNRKCVNSDHLEIVSIKENILRGEGLAAKNYRKIICPKGHSYKIIFNSTQGKPQRDCPICHSALAREYRKNHKEQFNIRRRRWRKKRKEMGLPHT